MVYDPYAEYRKRPQNRNYPPSFMTGNARPPGRDDEEYRQRDPRDRPPPPNSKSSGTTVEQKLGKKGGKGGGKWTGSEEHDYRKIEPPPPYPSDEDRDIASGRVDAPSEEAYDAAKSRVKEWRAWAARAGEYKMQMISEGIVPRMKQSELDMLNTYGQIGIPNIDVLGGYIWDTREGQPSDRYKDGKTPKGGGWVRMEAGQKKDISQYMNWWQETKEGRDWSKAWSGNQIVGRLVKNQFDKGMTDPNSSMAVGWDKDFKVYWDRGPAQKGDYGRYKFWDQFGRPTSAPKDWIPPNERASGGMDDNMYWLNSSRTNPYGYDYPQPGEKRPIQPMSNTPGPGDPGTPGTPTFGNSMLGNYRGYAPAKYFNPYGSYTGKHAGYGNRNRTTPPPPTGNNSMYGTTTPTPTTNSSMFTGMNMSSLTPRKRPTATVPAPMV